MRELRFMLAVLLMAAPPVASAQANRGTGGALFSTLDLSREQAKKISELTHTSGLKTRAIRARQHPGVPISVADRAELRKTNSDHNEAVRAILSPAQLQKLDAWVRARREAHIIDARKRVAERKALVPHAGNARRVP